MNETPCLTEGFTLVTNINVYFILSFPPSGYSQVSSWGKLEDWLLTDFQIGTGSHYMGDNKKSYYFCIVEKKNDFTAGNCICMKCWHFSCSDFKEKRLDTIWLWIIELLWKMLDHEVWHWVTRLQRASAVYPRLYLILFEPWKK